MQVFESFNLSCYFYLLNNEDLIPIDWVDNRKLSKFFIQYLYISDYICMEFFLKMSKFFSLNSQEYVYS